MTVIAGLAASLALAPVANASFEVLDFSGGAFNADGTSATQAGSHPASASTSFEFPAAGFLLPEEQFKDVEVDLPPGLLGDPTATPRCTMAQLFEERPPGQSNPDCAPATQVGLADLALALGPGANFFPPDFAAIPVYNMVPPHGFAAMLGFLPPVLQVPTLIRVRVRTESDYGVTAGVAGVSQIIPKVNGSRLTIWGVPNDRSHDFQRGYADLGLDSANRCAQPGADAASDWATTCDRPMPGPRRAFLTLPSNCSAGPLPTRIRAWSWQQPDRMVDSVFTTDLNSNPTAVTGCDKVPFDPRIDVSTTSSAPDSPTGLKVELSMPQEGLSDPDRLATANLRRARVRLPEGFTISPSGADGLEACTDAQLGLGRSSPSVCPNASRIGAVTVDTPLLDESVVGGVFVRAQASDDPASGEMFRIAIVASSEERGIHLKLAGKVHADPSTGRLVTSFDDNPQLPFSKLTLTLKSGPRAPLATPGDCGEKLVESSLTAWTGKAVDRTDSLLVDCPGTLPLSPSFLAGSASSQAGAFSPFLFSVERADKQMTFDKLSMELPAGLLASIKGALNERVGTVRVAVGPGSNPFWLTGQVFLEGPYDGAPYSLKVVVPAKAGPFDLGEVIVRQRLFVDPHDAHVRVVSDPLPTIVKGVPVRIRSVNVEVDRQDFTVNPTSCDQKKITAALGTVDGGTVPLTTSFQAVNCATLPFRPKLALRLTGKDQTKTAGHPGVKASVTQKGIGEASVRRAVVRLPKALALDPANAKALCEFADGTKPDPENHCPKGSIVGRARAVTPLLGKPLSGDVFFVKNVRRGSSGNLIRTLPMIVVALRGEIAINLRGKSSTTKAGKLVNTFRGVPDAPITRFNLNIDGGSDGILTVTRTARARIDLCTVPNSHRAEVHMDGHNGKRADFDARLKTPCARASRAQRRNAAKRKAAKRRGAAKTRDA